MNSRNDPIYRAAYLLEGILRCRARYGRANLRLLRGSSGAWRPLSKRQAHNAMRDLEDRGFIQCVPSSTRPEPSFDIFVSSGTMRPHPHKVARHYPHPTVLEWAKRGSVWPARAHEARRKAEKRANGEGT